MSIGCLHPPSSQYYPLPALVAGLGVPVGTGSPQHTPERIRKASLKGSLNVPLTLPQSGTWVVSTLRWNASIFCVRWAKLTGQSKLSLHRTRRPVGSDADLTNDIPARQHRATSMSPSGCGTVARSVRSHPRSKFTTIAIPQRRVVVPNLL